jgi:lipopolysaccharide/colanic/teichoic acid biosynthesis glycosyltransferase
MLLSYLDRYTPQQARRNEVRPGITGLAQARGRNALDWERKFDLDVWYVDHRCLALDARILAETVVTVLRGTGVSAPGSATMPEFQGVPAAAPERRR